MGPAEALKWPGLLLFAGRPGIDSKLYNHHLLKLVFHLRSNARAANCMRGHATSASKYYALLIEALLNPARFKQGQAVEMTNTLTYV